MNYSYLDLINLFWQKDIEHSFQPNEAALYFFILKTANALRWKNPVGLSNAKVMAQFGIGKKAFDTAKRNLKNAGLIDFRAGDGRGNVYQYTLCVESEMLSFDTSGIGKVRQKGREKVCSKDTLSDTLSGNLSGTLSARKGATSIDIEVDKDNTHTHSKKSAQDFPENSFPAGQNPEGPNPVARPPSPDGFQFPGKPEPEDVPDPPSRIIIAVQEAQFLLGNGEGKLEPELIIRYWNIWLPANGATGDKFVNHLSDIYGHFVNHCKKSKIPTGDDSANTSRNPNQPRPSGNFQKAGAAGPTRGRGASLGEMRRPRRRPTDDDSQRDDFTEIEIVE